MIKHEYDDVGSGRRKRSKTKKKPEKKQKKSTSIFESFFPEDLPDVEDIPFISDVFKWISTEGEFDRTNLNADIRAKARGCKVVMPEPDELFVDIDREEDYDVFKRNVKWLKKEKLVKSYEVKESPSGKPGHYHIVVKLNRVVRDAFERIGLQAILGSDRLREVLSWRNALNNSGRPTCFFEKEENVVKSVAGKAELFVKGFIKRIFK